MCLNMPMNAIELMKIIWNVFLTESWTGIETGMPKAERKLVSLAGLNAGGCTMAVSRVATRWRSLPFTDSVFLSCCRDREGSALAWSAPGGWRVVRIEWETSLFITSCSSLELLFSVDGLCVSSDGSSVDPGSDWNAPVEVWGNYEDPTSAPPPIPQQLLPEPTSVNLLTGVAVSLPEQSTAHVNVTAE